MTPKLGRRIVGVLFIVAGVYDFTKGGSLADNVANASLIAIGLLIFFWGAWKPRNP
jgi:hypothetical protein